MPTAPKTPSPSENDVRKDRSSMTPDQLEEEEIRRDRGRSFLAAGALAVAFTAVSAALVVATFLVDRERSGASAVPAMAVLAAVCLIAALVAPAAILAVHESRVRRRRQTRLAGQKLEDIAKDIKTDALGDLVSFNFQMMERFVDVALGQARSAYSAAAIGAAAALVVLLAGTATVMATENVAAQVTAGVLAAAGVALSGYISTTFLQTFRMTSRQMSYYYGQPLVHCYLLHAEWLGKRFEADADKTHLWQIRLDLISAALDASRNAQSHLLDLQRDVPTQRPATATATLIGELTGRLPEGPQHEIVNDGRKLDGWRRPKSEHFGHSLETYLRRSLRR
jgi:hypothetical protein